MSVRDEFIFQKYMGKWKKEKEEENKGKWEWLFLRWMCEHCMLSHSCAETK